MQPPRPTEHMRCITSYKQMYLKSLCYNQLCHWTIQLLDCNYYNNIQVKNINAV